MKAKELRDLLGQHPEWDDLVIDVEGCDCIGPARDAEVIGPFPAGVLAERPATLLITRDHDTR